MRALPLLLVVSGALAFAACSGGDDKASEATSSPRATGASGAASATVGGSPSAVASPSAISSSTATSTGTPEPSPAASDSPTATSQAAATATATQAAAVTPTATQPPAPTPTPAPTEAPAPPGPVTIEVTAPVDAAIGGFTSSVVRVRSGTTVTLILNNRDSGVQHNLGVNILQAKEHETCAGPCQTSQTFTAPAVGNYTFFCNLHANMFGNFIVDP